MTTQTELATDDVAVVHVPDRAPALETTPPPKQTLVAAGDLLRALAAPVRIAIVLQLWIVHTQGVTESLIAIAARIARVGPSKMA